MERSNHFKAGTVNSHSAGVSLGAGQHSGMLPRIERLSRLYFVYKCQGYCRNLKGKPNTPATSIRARKTQVTKTLLFRVDYPKVLHETDRVP